MNGLVNQNKPEYRVPSMCEIEAVESNGFSVVSTFAGCGGSCLGYRMAGFKVLWANEFIPAAAEVYRKNALETVLDTRDIRSVKPEDILVSTGLEIGEIDLLDGSPPCASFSTAGKREKSWGKVKAYSDTRQRTDDLFFEYARILKGLQPKVFVAENVSGLVKGTAKGYFKEILRALKECGYRVEAKLLDAQWLGVPQMRQRIIFLGVRNDLGLEPKFPKPLPYRYSVRDALPWIVSQGDNGGFGEGSMRDASRHASPTIGASPQTGNGKFAPSKVIVTNDSKGLEGIHVDNVNTEPMPTIRAGGGGHQLGWRVETDISKYAIGSEWDKLKPGEQSEKYFQLVKPSLEKPCPTILSGTSSEWSEQSCISKASVVHPTEKRKFTIAELKRICAFPDDFELTGSYAQQWERLGRAVPPVMMYYIAKTIRDEILCKLKS